MGRICVIESISLDGVMQGPGRSDEDERGGFAHGGWGDGYQDEISFQFMAELMAQGMADGAMLFGRRTYDDLLHHWTSVADPNPFTDHLTRIDKYVVSRSEDAALAYPNSTLLAGEATETVAALKNIFDGGLSIIGSGALVRSLQAARLIDEYIVQIHPIILGSGTRLFGNGERSNLKLERWVVTRTGLIIARYSVLQ